jgi:hypothetical protein
VAIGSPQYATISAAGNGDNTVVAAVAGYRIVVLGYVLVGSGAVNATWKSDTGGGAVALSGAIPLGAQTVVTAPAIPATSDSDAGYMQTASGKALNLNLSGAVGVFGHLSYALKAA